MHKMTTIFGRSSTVMRLRFSPICGITTCTVGTVFSSTYLIQIDESIHIQEETGQ